MYNRVFEEFKTRAANDKKTMSVWKETIKRLKKDIPLFRMGILELYYKDQDTSGIIKKIDALATIPIHIETYGDIKRDNDRRIHELFNNKIGLTLEQAKVSINEKDSSDTVVDHFRPVIGQDVPQIFEHFIFEEIAEKSDLENLKKQLTPAAVENKIISTINQFLAALTAKHPGKKNSLEQHKTEIINLLRMEIFLTGAIKTFTGADNAQKMDGLWEKISFKNKYTNIKLRKPFMALVFCMHNLEIPFETNEWWHEVTVYLRGFYDRVDWMMPDKYKKNGVIQKGNDGLYGCVDGQDEDMKSYFQGLTKYDMALYYLDMVNVLEPKLKPRKDIPHLLKLPQQRVPVNLFSIRRPTDDNYIPLKLQEHMREFRINGGTCEPEDKIDLLRRYVDNVVPFTRKQVEMLINEPDDLEGAVRKICDDYRKWDHTWAMLANFWSGWERKHSGLATELEHALEQNPDPQMQLREVYKIRDKLKPGKKLKADSTHLLPALDGILIDVFNKFIKSLPEATQEIRKSPTG